MVQHTATQNQETLKAFQEAVNMSAKELAIAPSIAQFKNLGK